ncbi:aspartate kinase [bacterium]|nr:aspartate kinase [bacterium]NIN91683.1 aspartate kinase [bacterium]NIO18035.1 aspartate kinase [bacterium]NIO72998.1 aspartate kinase [bacterium]
MALIVQKYGGTSIAGPERIKKVARRIIDTKKRGNRVVIVVSAPGDTTDELIKTAQQITPSPSEREMDMLLATGEQMSSAFLAMAIHALGEEAVSLTGGQVGIVTDETFTNAKIRRIDTRKIEKELSNDRIVIVAGFQGITAERDITTLGRGGSDLTAVALASVLRADQCEVYTDVAGVYTADPRIVSDARKIDRISYEEMLELASLGAQVMVPRSIHVANKFGVDIHVRSSFSDEEGTVITREVSRMEEVVVSGVAYDKDMVKVAITDVPDRPGIAAKIFGALGKEKVNVDMIIQSSAVGAGVNSISFTVARGALRKTLDTMEKVKQEISAKGIVYDDGVAKVSIVGVGMRTHSGVASKMFSALAQENINIEMISTSEIKISCVIKEKDTEKAVRAIHRKFGLGKAPGKGRK